MRFAISTDQNEVSAHFGRCPFFTIVDIENGKIVNKSTIENPGHQPGAIPQFLKGQAVEGIIAGGMGMRARGFFQEYGIETIVGVQGSIDEVIKQLEAGTLTGGESLCQPGSGKGYGLDKTVCDHPHEKHHKGEEKKGVLLCLTSEGEDLQSQIDQRFGRCKYFIFYDTGKEQFEVVQNENIDGVGGVGIQSGQLVAERGAKVVLTGKVGPNASQTLEAAGIDVVLDVKGTVQEAIEQYQNGKLKPAKGPNAEEKAGLEQ